MNGRELVSNLQELSVDAALLSADFVLREEGDCFECLLVQLLLWYHEVNELQLCSLSFDIEEGPC